LVGDKRVHVVPVGFEEDRAVFGLMELGASKIYLLVDGKSGSWGKEARTHAGRVEDRLRQVVSDQTILQKLSFDPTDYRSCEEVISKILDEEKDAQKVFLNISSSTKLCAVAFALKATEYRNVFLYYVVPKSYNVPGEGRPFSSGAQRIEVISPRGIRFNEWERRILGALDSKAVSSLGQLNKALVPDDVSKATRAKLSYYVRKLQQEGLIDFVPGRTISLTTVGKSKLHPPKDDARMAPLEA
jgi:hypothetical protein